MLLELTAEGSAGEMASWPVALESSVSGGYTVQAGGPQQHLWVGPVDIAAFTTGSPFRALESALVVPK